MSRLNLGGARSIAPGGTPGKHTLGRANAQSVGKQTLVERSAAGTPVQRAAIEGAAAPPGDASSVARDGVAGAGAGIPHAERIQQLFGRDDISHE